MVKKQQTTVLFLLAGFMFMEASADASWGPRMGTSGYAYEYFNAWPGQVTEIFGYSGRYIDSLGAMSTTGGYRTPVGGPGGGPYDIACPAGTSAVGLYGQSGTVVDAVGLICRKAEDPSLIYTGTTGGSGGGAYEYVCPDELGFRGVLTGLLITYGSYERGSSLYYVVRSLTPYCSFVPK